MKISSISLCALVVGVVSPVEAALVNFQLNSLTGVSGGTSYGAAFQGSVNWAYTSGSSATVTLSLTNTSSVTSNLAAFVVGLADSSMTISQVSAPTNFAQDLVLINQLSDDMWSHSADIGGEKAALSPGVFRGIDACEAIVPWIPRSLPVFSIRIDIDLLRNRSTIRASIHLPRVQQ